MVSSSLGSAFWRHAAGHVGSWCRAATRRRHCRRGAALRRVSERLPHPSAHAFGSSSVRWFASSASRAHD